MSDVRFSETSFAFALTAELMGRYFQFVQSGHLSHVSTTVTAIFPNLREEKKLGYDVMLPFNGTPLCYQFKLVEPHSQQQQNTLVKQYGLTGLTAPSYHFRIKKEQNKTLADLAQHLSLRAYYCAPKFHTIDDLNGFAASQAIVRNSIFIRPPVWPDGAKTHKVVFDLKGLHKLCSEPTDLNGVYTFEMIYEALAPQRRSTIDVLEELLQRLREILYRQEELWLMVDSSLLTIPDEPYDKSTLPMRTFVVYRWVSWILTVYFDVRLHLL